ncbi:glycosyltransferase [uncultured Winogradskyella sp.]|uniref:glycosyltransferase n=1 Tax=uncultured Winogradskyella sp. TaxID=395353 RepID=UPI0030DA0A45|tara:strand:+ start:104730 stop:105809 length:1080 start_codon:yes stop_codon:yes gene_type:complete
MKTRKKIFFILPTLFAGGAERVISFVSQNLDFEKFDVTLIIIGFKKDCKYEISGIPIIYLNKSRVLNGAFAIFKLISKQKPQIVVSSISHLNAMMGLISICFSKVIFIGRHASILDVTSKKNNKKSFLKKVFDYHSFGTKKLDYFICQSSDMKNNIIDIYNIDDKLIRIIHNPVTQIDIIKEKNISNDIIKYITVGRLSKIKGHLRILEVLSNVTFPFHYTIIGEGSYYDLIFSKIKELKLENKISHIKYTDNVAKYLVKSHIFLQGSYSEGFPNALLESCAVGTPVIAFKAPGGTKEIVQNGINGFIVLNEKDFLKKLSNNKEWNPMHIRQSVNEKFNKNKIINDYEQMFTDILNQHF